MKKTLAIAAITVASLTSGFSQNTIAVGDTIIDTSAAKTTKPVRSVPDGGTTVLLLGATLCGLYVASRKFAKA